MRTVLRVRIKAAVPGVWRFLYFETTCLAFAMEKTGEVGVRKMGDTGNGTVNQM